MRMRAPFAFLSFTPRCEGAPVGPASSDFEDRCGIPNSLATRRKTNNAARAYCALDLKRTPELPYETRHQTEPRRPATACLESKAGTVIFDPQHHFIARRPQADGNRSFVPALEAVACRIRQQLIENERKRHRHVVGQLSPGVFDRDLDAFSECLLRALAHRVQELLRAEAARVGGTVEDL